MKKYVADFETTVPKSDIVDPTTRVWAFGISEIGNTENFQYGTSIEEYIHWCYKEKNSIHYFHNLKFDGAFIIHYLLSNGFEYSEEKRDKTFNCIISSTGQFYSIEIIFQKLKKNYKKVTIYDSYKKLPFTVEKIAKDFGLSMQKLSIDYKEERPVGHILTQQEIDYLKNDVVIVATALGIQMNEGLKRMTIGSDALHEFKDVYGKDQFTDDFPVLPLWIDEQIRKAYKGGFTYLSKRYGERDIKTGIVFDVNSLYPAVMYYKPLPYGHPLPFKGQYEQDEFYPLYIQRITCEFTLKEKHIPTIQIKGLHFLPTEYIDNSGIDPVELTLTSVDMELFLKHYDVYVHEYLGGWKFKSATGYFKNYIDKWMKIKETSTGAKRLLAKLMLNSLYGKFCSSPDVTGKYPILENGILKFKMKKKEIVDPIYTAMGAFITAWARYTTITTAQSVYDRFIYADTDSLHLEGEEMPNIDIHPTHLGAWKHEGTFIRARFIRAKTYIEDILYKMQWDEKKGKMVKTNANTKDYEFSELHVTCAGMPDNVKKQVTWDNFRTYNENMYLPCRDGYYFGKLLPKQINGGILLVESEFKLKKVS